MVRRVVGPEKGIRNSPKSGPAGREKVGGKKKRTKKNSDFRLMRCCNEKREFALRHFRKPKNARQKKQHFLTRVFVVGQNCCVFLLYHFFFSDTFVKQNLCLFNNLGASCK